MSKSKLDSIYRRLLVNHFFERGWGKPENLRRLFEFRKIISNRQTCYPLVPSDYPVDITKKETLADCVLLEGSFTTPFELHLPGVVPKAAQQAHFQVLLPKKWKDERYKSMCIHLAGTGDHYFWRRRNFIAKPLLKEGNIGAILLENPFYGMRKPDDQVRSNLHNVSDIFVMGGCLILECLVLLHWCERHGLGPLGVTGLSMGGHMASLAACNWPRPLVLVPCLSWSTAATVFTTGVLSQSINWDILETQYHSDGVYRERLSKMVTIIDDAFMAGKNFIKDFNQSLVALKSDINNTAEQMSPYSTETKTGIFVENQMQNRSLTKNELKPDVTNISKLEIATFEASKQQTAMTPTQSTLTKLMGKILPKSAQKAEHKSEKFDVSKTKWWEREVLQFMRGMMDECTHLRNFSVPYNTSLIIAVCAKEDAYVPREGCSSLEDIWPGAEVRYLDAGHVSAYVLHQKLFRSCVVEAFERAKKIYDSNEGTSGEELKSTLTYEELVQKYAKSN